MKNILRSFLVTCLVAGIFNSADAQRRMGNNLPVVRRTMPTAAPSQSAQNVRERIGRSNATSNSAPVRSFQSPSSPAPRNVVRNSASQRTLTPRTITSPTVTTRPATVTNNAVATAPQRNFTQQPAGNSNTVSQNRTQRVIRQTNNNISRQNSVARNYSRQNNINNYNTSRYRGNYYRTNYRVHPVYMYGPRYTSRPRSSISIYFGGNPYYYTDGYYYGYYDGFYRPVFPPYGLRISTLPFGYSRIFIGAAPYYYYNGIYYREFPDNNTYEVVDAPMGATVSSLPKGAKSVKVNGEKLYELNGTYYKEDRNEKGKKVYIVVGKNGEVNNSIEEQENIAPLEIGDLITELPEGSKVVTINGEELYQTPDGTFFTKELKDDTVHYKVVGK